MVDLYGLYPLVAKKNKGCLLRHYQLGFFACPFNDLAALEKMMDEEFCAVILELVQGEGGVHLAKTRFLANGA